MSIKFKYLEDYIKITATPEIDKKIGKVKIKFIYFPEDHTLFIDEDKSKLIPTIDKTQLYIKISKEIFNKIEQENIKEDFNKKREELKLKELIEENNVSKL